MAAPGRTDLQPSSGRFETTTIAESPILPYHKRPSTCLTCAQRKVKCDRAQPCAACQKSHLECTYERQDKLPRKRKPVASLQELSSKVRLYEEALHSAGITLPKLSKPNPEKRCSAAQSDKEKVHADPHFGHALTVDSSGTRYYEQTMLAEINHPHNEEPISTVAIEEQPTGTFTDPDSAGYQTGEISMECLAGQLCSLPLSGNSTFDLDIDELLNLIDTFFDNVNPLIMLLPKSSGRQLLVLTAGGLSCASPAQRALLFAACTCSLVSRVQPCSEVVEPQVEINLRLAIYHHLTWKELMAASYLRSSDPKVLQAFLLLLTSMQHDHDPVILWTLLGLAARQGQRMGFHRDGIILGLSPRETELRRRVWWYLVTLDLRITEVSGCARVIGPESWDTKMPLNINDEDIDPDTKATPKERNDFTDMTFCLIHYEIAQAIRRHRDWLKQASESSLALETYRTTSGYSDALGPLKTATELQESLESKYLRFCDPIVPLHNFTANMARSMLSKFRIVSLLCRSGSANDERLKSSIRVVKYDNMIRGTKCTHGFVWYAENYFEGGVLLQLLKRLNLGAEGIAEGTSTPEVEQVLNGRQLTEAWQQLEEFFQNNPKYTKPSQPFHAVVAKRAVEAWKLEARRRSSDQMMWSLTAPSFVEVMETALAQRTSSSSPSNHGDSSKPQNLTHHSLIEMHGYGTKMVPVVRGTHIPSSPSNTNNPFPMEDFDTRVDPWLAWDEAFLNFDDGTGNEWR